VGARLRAQCRQFRSGARANEIVEGTLARGIYLRDRSKEPGCDGGIRIATGVVAHTRRCIDAIEEVLCAAR
jgi:histidinol-phosphate aminotransferase